MEVAMNGFAEIFKYLRLREGLTQKEMADRLGIAKSTVSMYENGNREPDFELLEQIADYFNVDMNFLLGKDKDERYFLDEKTTQIAQEIFDNEELKLLFDAAVDSSPEDLKTVHDMLLALKRKENHEDD